MRRLPQCERQPNWIEGLDVWEERLHMPPGYLHRWFADNMRRLFRTPEEADEALRAQRIALSIHPKDNGGLRLSLALDGEELPVGGIMRISEAWS